VPVVVVVVGLVLTIGAFALVVDVTLLMGRVYACGP